MDRRQWLGLAAIAGGLGIVGYAVLSGPGDEEEIRAQLDALAQAVSTPEPVGNAVFRASYLRERFGEVLAPEVRIDVSEMGRLPADHRQLALATARMQVGLGLFDVELRDVSVELGAGQEADQARAQATAVMTATGGQGRQDSRRVLFTLLKRSGTWWVADIHARPPE